MGYGGYAPGANSRVQDQRTDLEEALRALPVGPSLDTLELIEKLTRNVVRNPGEDKFRHVKLSNPKIAAAIAEVPNAVALMKAMGWQEESEGLVLPPSVTLAHEREVVAIIDAKDHYKKEAEKERRRQLQAQKESDPEREALQRQVEADRKEKQAEGPITRSSKARKLGDGANIMRASDIGIGVSSGGG